MVKKGYGNKVYLFPAPLFRTFVVMKTSIVDDRKECSKCSKFLPFKDFGKDSKVKCGLTASCRECTNSRFQRWRSSLSEVEKVNKAKRYKQNLVDKGKVLTKEQRREKHLKYYYNITRKHYNNMLELQYSKCLICKCTLSDKFRGHVDHDHQSGVIRGILCRSCNLGLGHFRDDENILQSAITYLATSRSVLLEQETSNLKQHI